MFYEFSANKKIYYEDHKPEQIGSEKQPLVLIPGWTMAGSVFSRQKDHFAKDRRVILFDPPGCGKTSRFAEYSFELYAQVVQKLCTALKIKSPHLVGWSMGGEIVLKIIKNAELSPQTVILISSTPCFMNRPDWQNGMPEAVARRFEQSLKKNLMDTLRLFFAETLKGNKDLEAEGILIKAGKHTDKKCAQDMFAELLKQDLRGVLAELRRPCYIISGKEDALCPATASVHMQTQIPDSIHDPLEAGHVPFISETDFFNKKIQEFLAHNDR